MAGRQLLGSNILALNHIFCISQCMSLKKIMSQDLDFAYLLNSDILILLRSFIRVSTFNGGLRRYQVIWDQKAFKACSDKDLGTI